jgi:hypothetical protein
MMLMALKIFISAAMIAFCSWLAGAKPQLAGLIVALPLTSLIVIPISYLEWKDPNSSVLLAKGIFYGIPLSLLFFVPFLLAEVIKVDFWVRYAAGLLLLVLGYAASLYFFGTK